MDINKMALKGSEAHDAFKQFHKTGNPSFYAADGDLFLVAKQPRGIVALLDYKNPETDNLVAFGSALLYEHLMAFGIPVFVIFSIPPFESITVNEITFIDPLPRPPSVKFVTRLDAGNPDDFFEWERKLRIKALRIEATP